MKKTTNASSKDAEKKEKKSTSNRRRGKPISEAELFKRLEVVEKTMENGQFAYKQIQDAIVEAGFPSISHHTAGVYMRRVREQWEAEKCKDRDMIREAALRRVRRYYDRVQKQLNKIDPKHADAVSLLKEIHRIEGVYAPEKMDIRRVADFDDWSDKELDEFIATGKEPARVTESGYANEADEEVEE
jgi:hypothetical protein